MLEILEQKFDKDGNIVFKKGHSPSYTQSDSETIKGVMTSLEANSPSLLSIMSYTKPLIAADIDLRNIVCMENKLNLDDLIKALKNNTHLIELYLDAYEITDEQAKELSEVLTRHPLLNKLSLTNCRLTRQGAAHLAKGIEQNKKINTLILDETKLLDNSINEIDRALKNNHFITTFQHKGSILQESIQSSVERNKQFFELCAKLEGNFLLLESFIPLEPKNEKPQRLLRIQKLLGPEKWRLSSEGNNKVINAAEKVDRDTRIVGVLAILYTMLDDVEKLKQKGFNAHADLIHRITHISAQFYLTTNNKTEFYKLYGDYFISHHPDPIIDLEFAKEISQLEHTLKYNSLPDPETKKKLSLLGLYEDHLRYQYLINRLENNQDPEAIKLCKLYRNKLKKATSKSTYSSSSKTSSKSKTKSKTKSVEKNTAIDSKKQTTENREVEKKISLKHTLAQSLGYGPYERIFSERFLTTKMITLGHSRIISAERLGMLSSDFTYDQMKKILQVEYAALPNTDKKADSSFFTAYRHRTLEKALEAVFEKESIALLPSNVIHDEQNKNLSLAFDILQWIGNQERSFSYKTSNNSVLFNAMETLGRLAHQMVACDKPEALAELKKRVKGQLGSIATFVDVTSLIEKFQPSNPNPYASYS